MRTERGILIEPAPETEVSLEQEPEFPRFLAFLQRAALMRPDALVNVAELTAGDDRLFAGVELDR